MANEWKFQIYPGLRERALEALEAAESEGKNVADVLWSGTSGVAAGKVQVDLGWNPNVADKLVEAGVKNGQINDEATKARVSALLKIQFAKRPGEIFKETSADISKTFGDDGESVRRHHQANLPTTKPKIEELKKQAEEAKRWANDLIGTKEGAEVIKKAGEEIIDKNIAQLPGLCGNAAPQAQEFCNSEQGQIEIVGFLHQNGGQFNKEIRNMMRGETVTIGDPAKPKKVRVEGKMDIEQFREKIRDNTKFGRSPANKKGLANRDKKMDTFYRSKDIYDGSRDFLNPPLPPIPVPRDTAPRPDAAKPEKHSALPDDEADAPVQSAEAAPSVASLQQPAPEQNTNVLEMASLMPDERSARGPKVWRPDSGALADAVMQAGGTGLPIWTQMLLGRDAMTNGSRAAVKGFQNAINAATKPPGFDYHWGLGGREGRIDVDGDLGPQTLSGFVRAVDKHGDKGFARIYALDQFGRYTKGLDTGLSRIGDLEDTLASTLGQVTPDAGARAQETLNIARDMIGDRQRYAPLKVDGWVGPVTSDAFKRAYDTFGSTRLFERFAGPDFWDEGV